MYVDKMHTAITKHLYYKQLDKACDSLVMATMRAMDDSDWDTVTDNIKKYRELDNKRLKLMGIAEVET